MKKNTEMPTKDGLRWLEMREQWVEREKRENGGDIQLYMQTYTYNTQNTYKHETSNAPESYYSKSMSTQYKRDYIFRLSQPLNHVTFVFSIYIHRLYFVIFEWLKIYYVVILKKVLTFAVIEFEG